MFEYLLFIHIHRNVDRLNEILLFFRQSLSFFLLNNPWTQTFLNSLYYLKNYVHLNSPGKFSLVCISPWQIIPVIQVKQHKWTCFWDSDADNLSPNRVWITQLKPIRVRRGYQKGPWETIFLPFLSCSPLSSTGRWILMWTLKFLQAFHKEFIYF